MLKKIVIIGPESTGKSTLCKQLAEHYQTLWCPEFARQYLLKHGMNYEYDDLLTIAKGQLALEGEYERSMGNRRRAKVSAVKKSIPGSLHFPLSKGVLSGTTPLPIVIGTPFFIDTDMYVMKVWCEFVFGKCHPFILEQIAKRKYDCYLLCNVDLPWVKDELREYPDLETRSKLYSIYKNIMVNQSVPWVDVSGCYEERLQKAITGVDNLLV